MVNVTGSADLVKKDKDFLKYVPLRHAGLYANTKKKKP